MICSMCEDKYESSNHLFYECKVFSTIFSFNQDVLYYMAKVLKLVNDSMGTGPKKWLEELCQVKAYAKGKSPKNEVFRLMLFTTVYFMWRERNARVFQTKQLAPQVVIKLITQEIHLEPSRMPKWRNSQRILILSELMARVELKLDSV